MMFSQNGWPIEPPTIDRSTGGDTRGLKPHTSIDGLKMVARHKWEVHPETVTRGTVVTVRDIQLNSEQDWEINKIVDSPLGCALLDKEKYSVVKVFSPHGDYDVEILSIRQA